MLQHMTTDIVVFLAPVIHRESAIMSIKVNSFIVRAPVQELLLPCYRTPEYLQTHVEIMDCLDLFDFCSSKLRCRVAILWHIINQVLFTLFSLAYGARTLLCIV